MISALFIFSFLGLLVSSVSLSDKGNSTFLLRAGDIKRLHVSTDIQYEFIVDVNDTTEWSGMIFQVHSQYHMITLSESHDLEYGNYTVGTNIGLWHEFTTRDISTVYYVTISCEYCNNTEIAILVAVVTVDINAPIPGGCTLTSSIETDPNIKLNFTTYTTTVRFEDGNLGYDPLKGEFPLSCTHRESHDSPPSYKLIEYTVYHRLLNIRDYDTGDLFDAIEDVLTKKSIKKQENLARVKMDAEGYKKLVVDSYAGDGVVYNILASNDGRATAYVPAVTYACEFKSDGTCKGVLPIVDIVISPLISLIGLFLCLTAHRLWHIEVYIFSVVIFVIVFYLITSNFIPSTHTVRITVAVIIGLWFGLMLFLFWFLTAWYLPFVLLFTSSSGLLVTATMLYIISFIPVDSLSFFKISYVYGLLIVCVTVILLIPAVLFPRAMNIFTSSFVGSYLVIFGIGTFVLTSITQILMRVIKNATISGYMKTDANYPFQINDIILVILWFLVMVAGIIIQVLLVRKREPFPKTTLYSQCRKKLNKRRQYVINDERRKLLDNYCGSPTGSMTSNEVIN